MTESSLPEWQPENCTMSHLPVVNTVDPYLSRMMEEKLYLVHEFMWLGMEPIGIDDIMDDDADPE